MPIPKLSSEVKLDYVALGLRIKNHRQKDWITACKRLELVIPEGGGAGSHVAVYKKGSRHPYDSACLVLTIVKKPYPQIQLSMVKNLVLGGFQSGNYTAKDA